MLRKAMHFTVRLALVIFFHCVDFFAVVESENLVCCFSHGNSVVVGEANQRKAFETSQCKASLIQVHAAIYLSIYLSFSDDFKQTLK